jgi:hypothetical protein
MDRDAFWRIIDNSRCGSDLDRQIEKLNERLTALSAEELIEFERHLTTLSCESYSWDLWGAAYLINGGCSDDGFEYFRSWLIAQGRSTFESAVVDPDSLADLPDLGGDVELEELSYVAQRAYEDKTGKPLPDEVYQGVQRRELGEDWDFDDPGEMARRYPKLFAKFGE